MKESKTKNERDKNHSKCSGKNIQVNWWYLFHISFINIMGTDTNKIHNLVGLTCTLRITKNVATCRTHWILFTHQTIELKCELMLCHKPCVSSKNFHSIFNHFFCTYKKYLSFFQIDSRKYFLSTVSPIEYTLALHEFVT